MTLDELITRLQEMVRQRPVLASSEVCVRGDDKLAEISIDGSRYCVTLDSGERTVYSEN
jgi:hypothetical protein